MSIFLKPPPDLEALPPPIAFTEVTLDGIRVSSTEFSPETEDVSPRALQELAGASGEPIAFSRFGRLTVLFTRAEHVAQVLLDYSHSFLKGEEERALAAVVGWGLLAQEGSAHRSMQKALNPGIRGQVLDTYLEVVDTVTGHHIDTLAKDSTPLVEFSRQLSQAAAEATIFGSTSLTADPAYHRAVLETNHFSMSGATPGRPSASEGMAPFRASRNIIQRHVERLVESWRSGGRNTPTFMHYVLAGSENSDDPEARLFDQAGMFLQAATETTASLVSWSLVHLSGQESLWRKLHDEAQSLGDQPLTHQAVKSLELHQAVISETLRVASPVWLLPRVVAEQCDIGGIVMPRGTRVFLSPWVTHRLEQYFDEPTEFRPERWLGASQPTRGSYFPFGLGGRICIGESYGRMVAATVIYHLSRAGMSVRVTPDSKEIGASHLLSMPRLDLRAEIG